MRLTYCCPLYHKLSEEACSSERSKGKIGICNRSDVVAKTCGLSYRAKTPQEHVAE